MASINDRITDVTAGGSNPNVARVTATRSGGGTTLTCDNLSGWPVAATGAVHFSTYRIDTSNAVVANSQTDWKGLVTSSTTIGSLTRQAGASDTGNAIGDVVEMNPTGSYAHDLYTALSQEHNVLDGTHKAITATSVTSAGAVSGTTGSFSTSVTEAGTLLQTLRSEVMFDHVASGCVITADSAGVNKNYSISSGVVYIGGKRVTVNAVSAQTVTASKDRYIDVDNTGTLTTTSGEVNNNAASPALAANSIRLGIVVAGATTIANAASINQGQEDRVLPIASSIAYSVTDSLGNLICPRDPQRKTLGYRQILADFTTTSATAVQITGLTCPVIVPTGRKVKITVFAYKLGNSSGTNTAEASIWDGVVASGTRLNVGDTISVGAGATAAPANIPAVTTPTSASKTYNAGALASAGTTTVGAAATAPAYIQVELV